MVSKNGQCIMLGFSHVLISDEQLATKAGSFTFNYSKRNKPKIRQHLQILNAEIVKPNTDEAWATMKNGR